MQGCYCFDVFFSVQLCGPYFGTARNDGQAVRTRDGLQNHGAWSRLHARQKEGMCGVPCLRHLVSFASATSNVRHNSMSACQRHLHNSQMISLNHLWWLHLCIHLVNFCLKLPFLPLCFQTLGGAEPGKTQLGAFKR